MPLSLIHICKVSLTGNLGDVMKESATIAHEWTMAHYKELGIDPKLFETNDINIHVPEGAIPKDGPSAGITMVTSIVSSYKMCIRDSISRRRPRLPPGCRRAKSTLVKPRICISDTASASPMAICAVVEVVGARDVYKRQG